MEPHLFSGAGLKWHPTTTMQEEGWRAGGCTSAHSSYTQIGKKNSPSNKQGVCQPKGSARPGHQFCLNIVWSSLQSSSSTHSGAMKTMSDVTYWFSIWNRKLWLLLVFGERESSLKSRGPQRSSTAEAGKFRRVNFRKRERNESCKQEDA